MPKVRDAIRLVEGDGWKHVRTRGSHRHYRHSTKTVIVTIAGKLSKELAPKTWNSILKQAGIHEGGQS
ncbi:MAG: type II toxin-antitoxin system HicA family toxin [Chloroflexi bacterium]|nr:type II toxin-antitoxin system HicA family toxin [Chloroflexota bacterium]